MTLNVVTKEFLNVAQNKCIRQIVGLKKFCRISNILKCLKIFNFNQLYIYTKLNFINSIHNNELSLNVLLFLFKNKECTNKSVSFKKDILSFESYFSTNINLIVNNFKFYKETLKSELSIKDNGLCNSIKILQCLNNINIKFFKNFLDNLTRVDFYEIA